MQKTYEQQYDAQKARMSTFMRQGVEDVSDSLKLAWVSAQAVFADQATPEHALKILELWLNQTNHHERLWHEMRIRDLNAADQDQSLNTGTQ